MLFDTHAHYDDDWFDEDRDALLASMPEKGVGLIVNPGITVETSRRAIAMAEKYPHVYAAVGIHPENCHDFVPQHIDALRELSYSPLRGNEAVREATIAVGDKEIKLAVVHGLAHAKELLKAIDAGEAYYDLVEVMTCPGGCVGGFSHHLQ